jgi:hypothetical protein
MIVVSNAVRTFQRSYQRDVEELEKWVYRNSKDARRLSYNISEAIKLRKDDDSPTAPQLMEKASTAHRTFFRDIVTLRELLEEFRDHARHIRHSRRVFVKRAVYALIKRESNRMGSFMERLEEARGKVEDSLKDLRDCADDLGVS